MTTSKKPKSKPAAKKKAASKTIKKLNSFTPGADRRIIEGIAARVEELAASFVRAHQKLDYLVVRSDPQQGRLASPLVEEAAEKLESGEA